tara:strand:+ start:448 stop:1614 length:1167 start_codon:yes stop_codon:yes gene_type:complete
MPKNDNGYSFQPDLMDKMYEDKKEEKRKAEKEAERIKKKKEAEEKLAKKEKEREKRKKKRKKKKKKKKTFEDKMGESALAIVLIPFVVIGGIYLSSCYLDIILKSTPGSKFLKEFFPDGEGVPYGKGEQGAGISCKEIKAFLPKRETTIDGVDAVQKGGRRKKYVQKGGFDKNANDRKGFLDSTKYGIPYDGIENGNFFISGIGNYFKTFWQGIRGGIKKVLLGLNELLYKDNTTPSGFGEQAIDYLKFTLVLPFAANIMNILLSVGSLILLFWSAINNQTFMIIPLLIFGILCVFLGWFAPPPFQYFWPWGLIALYSLVFVLKPNDGKTSNFMTYGRRYKWMWCFNIALLWLISIGSIWDWKQEAMIFIGSVVALLFTGMLGITNFV